MLQHALAMAERGLGVFPIKEGAKFPPLINDWPHKATTDEQQIRSWWTRWPEANVGVHCKDHIILDADVKGGKQGLQSLEALGIEHDTFTVDTPSGGVHEYFRGAGASNSVGSLGPGLDVRSDHGYVLASGSIVGGIRYVVRDNQREIREASDTLLQHLRARAVRSEITDASLSSTITLDTPTAVDRATHFLLGEAPLAVEGAGGDALTFKLACALKDFGVSEFMAWDLMVEHWNDRCSPPWSAEELETKVRNAYAYGVKSPGVETPELNFKGVDIAPPPRPGRRWFYPEDSLNLNETWLFHKLLPAKGVAVFVGPTGSGKTFLIAHAARCLGTGKTFFGVAPDQKGGTAVLFAGTEGSGFAHRLAALEEPKGTLPVTYTYVSGLNERKALDNLISDLKDQDAYLQQRYGVPLRMVVLETLSASGLIEKENDNSQAAQAITNLATISAMLGVLVVISHHPPKGGEGTRGAEAIPSNSDYVVEITRYQKNKVRDVAITKARNAEERKLGTFSLVEVTIGKDDKDRPVTSMSVTTGDVAAAAREKTGKNDELFIECLEHTFLDDDAEKTKISGKTMVRVEDVRDLFNMRCSIKDRSNRAKTFNQTLAKAEGLGLIETEAYETDTWIVKKEIKL